MTKKKSPRKSLPSHSKVLPLMVEHEVGSGVSKAVEIWVDEKDNFPPLRIEDLLTSLEEEAKKTISTDGTPTDPGETRVSPRWYAAEEIDWIKAVRYAISCKDIERVALTMWTLGREFQEAKIKFGVEIQRTRLAGQATAKKRRIVHTQWIEQAREIWSRHNWSAAQVARQIQDDIKKAGGKVPGLRTITGQIGGRPKIVGK